MLYQAGDYVYPTDLTRPTLCRVAEAERLGTDCGSAQILKLEPLEGPWPDGTLLIRLDASVTPAWPRQLVPTAATPDWSIWPPAEDGAAPRQ